jgi:hypothetical protein
MGSPDPASDAGRRENLSAYCLVAGVVAATVGAVASLPGAGFVQRAVLWALVLVLVAAAAGWWWVRDPVTAYRWTVGLLVRPAARGAASDRPSRRFARGELPR